MTIRLRLVLWYSGAFALGGFVLLLVVYFSFMRSLRSEVDRMIEDEFDEWSALAAELYGDPDRLREEIGHEVRSEPRVLMAFRLHDTRSGADIVALPAEEPFLSLYAATRPTKVPAAKTWREVRVGDAGAPWRILEGPFDPAHPDHAVQVAMEASRLEEIAAALRGRGLLVAAVLFLLATAGGWILAARSLRPIDEVAAELSRVESETLGQRLAVDGSRDEIARLRLAINRMLGRLQDAFDKQRHFIAAAAHELRSPLAALRCRLELAAAAPRAGLDPREVVAEIFGEVERLSSLVENLLLLARIDAGEGLPRLEAIDLATFLGELLEPFSLLADEKGVALSLDCPPGIALNGDPFLLRRLFGNLLDNAIRYTPRGGRVTVRAVPRDDGAAVDVEDTGIGMGEETRSRLFDRFFRAGESRSRDEGGAGLGLSIAKGAVDLHRGTIEFLSRPGEGTCARLWLPADPRAEITPM